MRQACCLPPRLTASGSSTATRPGCWKSRNRTRLWSHRRQGNGARCHSFASYSNSGSRARHRTHPRRRQRVSLKIQPSRRHAGSVVPGPQAQRRATQRPQPGLRWHANCNTRGMRGHDLPAHPTTNTSPLVVRHPVLVPAVWQGSLRMDIPTSIAAETVMVGPGSDEPGGGQRPVQLASEKRSAVPDGILRSGRS